MQHSRDIVKAVVVPPSERGAVVPDKPRVQHAICMLCKCPIQKGVINRVSEGFDWERMKTIDKPCPACSAETVRQEAAKREASLLSRIFGDAQIPWRARNWTFETFPEDADQRAKQLMMDFVDRHLNGDQENKRMFFLGGATGRGKTGLAISALKEVLAARKSGLYLMVPELMIKLQSTFGKNADFSQDELLRAVTSVEWLVMDDLGVESSQDKAVSSYTLRMLYLIIQKRSDRGLYTIFTSNLSLNDLEEYWRPAGCLPGSFHEGLRITERLREYCEGRKVDGRNQRC